MQSSTPAESRLSRILALDYLRGFFIVVIIIDHIWRWPNLLQFISGRGELWASAAEGFVIISGLLVGYVRGYKNRNQPLRTVSGKLIRRGLMLYLWMLITTFGLVAASWFISFKGSIANIPIERFDWNQLIADVLNLTYVHTLTHFLYLYAIFLVLAPLVVWGLRRGKWPLVAVVSIAIWVLGIHFSIEWMQWQILFFVPAIVGYYLDAIFDRYYRLQLRTRRTIRYSSIIATLATAAISMGYVFAAAPGQYDNILFSPDMVTLPIIVTAFVWFAGLLSLTQLLLPKLRKWLGWLLPVFGERSLTGYILHVIPLLLCQFLFADSLNIWVNTAITIACIMGAWALLKIPGINRVVPR
jgi:hypothetical protein